MSLQMRFGFGTGRWQRLRCCSFLVGCLVAVATGFAADPKPPSPNPANPVDYIKWINETMGGDLEDNAYDTYQQACDLITPLPENEAWDPALREPWSGNQVISDWLKANRKGLKTFAKAAKKRECFFPLGKPKPTGDARMDGAIVNVLIPNLPKLRNAAKGLIAEGFYNWQKGRHRTLPKNAILVIRSGHHLDTAPTTIGRFVGIAQRALGYHALTKALSLADNPDKLATGISRKLAKADPEPQPFSQIVDLERLFLWDICQRFFVPARGRDAWKIHRPSQFDFNRRDVHTVKRIGYHETLRELNAYYDALDKWASSPYYRVKEQVEQLGSMVEKSKNPFVRKMAAHLTKVRLLGERSTAYRRATHLLVHIFVHHGKTGSFPESLSELGAPDLAKLRIDPFSGSDFVYKRNPSGFTLYSVADNLKDDGGKHNQRWEKDDYVFWPVQE